MRGLKDHNSTKEILKGFTVHYNFVRPHQSLDGETPAQASGIKNLADWKSLIEQATQHEAQLYKKATQEAKSQAKQAIAVMAK